MLKWDVDSVLRIVLALTCAHDPERLNVRVVAVLHGLIIQLCHYVVNGGTTTVVLCACAG